MVSRSRHNRVKRGVATRHMSGGLFGWGKAKVAPTPTKFSRPGSAANPRSNANAYIRNAELQANATRAQENLHKRRFVSRPGSAASRMSNANVFTRNAKLKANANEAKRAHNELKDKIEYNKEASKEMETIADALYGAYTKYMFDVMKDLAENPSYSVEQLTTNPSLKSSKAMDELTEVIKVLQPPTKAIMHAMIKEQVAKIKLHTVKVMSDHLGPYVKRYENARQATNHKFPDTREHKIYKLFMERIKGTNIVKHFNSGIRKTLHNAPIPTILNTRRNRRNVNLNRGSLNGSALRSAARAAAATEDNSANAEHEKRVKDPLSYIN